MWYVYTVSEETGSDKPYLADTIMTPCHLYRSESHEIVVSFEKICIWTYGNNWSLDKRVSEPKWSSLDKLCENLQHKME